jgi:hypothetical protein
LDALKVRALSRCELSGRAFFYKLEAYALSSVKRLLEQAIIVLAFGQLAKVGQLAPLDL